MAKHVSAVIAFSLLSSGTAYAQDERAGQGALIVDQPAAPVTDAPTSKTVAPVPAAGPVQPSAPTNPTELNRFPPEETGFGAKAGPCYSVSRWNEDWSFLRDPGKRRDTFDPVKYIPLNGEGDAYLTLSGLSRLRYETYSNRGLRETPEQDNLLLRTIVGADLHLGKSVRLYGELASGQQSGSSAVNTNQRNDLIVQQLFAQVSGEIAGLDAGLIVGRQHFLDGPIQFVSTRENTNIQITWQGVRAYARGKRARADVFSFRSVELGGGAFDDPTGDRRFRGALASFVVSPEAAKKPLLVDPFLFSSRETRTWGGRTGREHRDFYGVRVHGGLGAASIDWTAAYQSGDFAGRPLRAWSVFTDQSLGLGSDGWKPRIGFHADASSGGGAFGTGTLRNADTLFGVLPYLSDGLSFGFINLVDVSPTLNFAPAKGVTVRSEFNFLWRTNSSDAVYMGTKVPYAGTERVTGSSVGQQARLRVAWVLNPHVTLAGTFEHVFAGDVLRRAGYKDSTFTASQITFKF